MLWFFVIGYLLSVGVIAAIAVWGPFAWFGLNAVLWFGGFLAVVLGVIYLFGKKTGAFGTGGGGGGTARASKYDSKGARSGDR